MEKRLRAAVPCSQALKSDVDAIHCVGVDNAGGAAGSGHRARHAPTACGPDLLAAGGDWGSSSIGAGPPPWPSTSTPVGGRHGNGAAARGGCHPPTLARARSKSEDVAESKNEEAICD